MNMIKSAMVAAALMSFASAANAAVIDLDTLVGWDLQDQFDVLGTFYTNTDTTTLGTRAKFTDLFVQGDEYEIYVNGIAQFTSLAPVADGTFLTDPDAAFDSNKYAKGFVTLAAGDVLSFKAITIPAGYTEGILAVTNAVPEPASWVMLIAGFGLVGAAMRRRAHSALTA